MELLDWIVMLGTLLGIAAYGMWKTRRVRSTESYLRGDKDLPWWTIGLSIMATQASAITFLSTPGQAYADGMRFVQFYFGMPVAMVLLSIFFLPIYYRLNVYTAYEYLEGRFGVATRTLTASLFLLSRGMAAGITIYAPAIILSSILGWNLTLTNLFIGILVIIYTVAGGTKAVSYTQKQQMIVILSGMTIAGLMVVWRLPADVSFLDAVGIAGQAGKLNVVNFEFDLQDRYTFWSGMLGGVFLFMSYFGTDQSQVQRYLSGRSLSESRVGLLFNGIVKVPMQFLILFAGVLVFVFFQFEKPPLHFNTANVEKVTRSALASDFRQLEAQHSEIAAQKVVAMRQLMAAMQADSDSELASAKNQITSLTQASQALQSKADSLILRAAPDAETRDEDYVFITFVLHYLPVGLVGLLLAVIFAAAMSSISSELNALATTTVVDIYRRNFVRQRGDRHYLRASQWFTVLWGMLALLFAEFASLFENLIQAVNIVGSLFYGVILGIFTTAFFLKKVRGRAVFLGAILAEMIVIGVYLLDTYGHYKIGYLWLNLIGCSSVMLLSWILEVSLSGKNSISPTS
jgi:SSS family transporter